MRQVKALYPPNHSGADFIRELTDIHPLFYSDVTGLRYKWKIDPVVEIHIFETNKVSAKQERLLKNKKFVSNLQKLQKKFQLGEEWSSFISDYIFIDFLATPTSTIFVEKRANKDGDAVTSKPAFFVRIFPETTLEDISGCWAEINKFIGGSNKKTKRRKPTRTGERNSVIYALARMGWSIPQIDAHIKLYFDQDMDYGAIITAEARHRKKFGIKESTNLRIQTNKP